MIVPEAAVYKDYLATGREDQVGPTGQVGSMKPVPVTKAVQKPAHHDLRLGALRLDSGHDAAAGCGGYGVRHVWHQLSVVPNDSASDGCTSTLSRQVQTILVASPEVA